MPSTNEWRFIEIGRLVLITRGKYENKVATVVDVVDQNRVLVDSPPADSAWTGIPRHVVTLRDCEATPVATSIQRGLKAGKLTKAIKEQNTLGRWEELKWAKKIQFRDARTNINDFDRFCLDKARRTRAFTLRKKLADKLTKAGKKEKAAKVFKA